MIDLKIREEELSNMSDYNRVAAMVKRVPLQDEVVFAGGCAYNPCLKGLLEKSLGRNIQMAPILEMTGVLGAALLAEQSPV